MSWAIMPWLGCAETVASVTGGGWIRRLDQAGSRGERAFLTFLTFLKGSEVPVYVASYWLKRDGKRERRFVLSTKALSQGHIVRWGKRRWCIEGFFKTAKGRFSLDRFGQGTRLWESIATYC